MAQSGWLYHVIVNENARRVGLRYCHVLNPQPLNLCALLISVRAIVALQT